MPDEVQVEWNGRVYPLVPVPVVSAQEYWNQYVLEDGSSIKMKSVVSEVLRLEGARDGDGNLVYMLKSGNVTSVNSTKG